jgi:Tol biopolymer transport system component
VTRDLQGQGAVSDSGSSERRANAVVYAGELLRGANSSSPTGSSEVATSDESSTVWLVHPNGDNRHRITTTAGGSVTWEGGSFSPDGQRIVATQGAFISVLSKQGDILRNVTAPDLDGGADWGARPS